MITSVQIPKLTLTMEGGTVVRWFKKEGERIEQDEALFELETDKATVEVPAPAGGLLRKVVVHEGAVAVGAVVAFIGDALEPLPDAIPISTVGLAAPEQSESQTLAGVDVPGPGIVRATPAARRRARELGLSLSQVTGTGPDGRILVEDVERAPSQSGRTWGPPGQSPRQIIARRTTEAWRTVPHIHIGGELKAEGLKRALDKAKKDVSAGVSMTDLLLYTTASLLPAFPMLNAVWREDHPEPQPQIHLAVAIQTERGVMAPVIRDAGMKSLAEISAERKRLMNCLSGRRLRPSDLEGGTFTLTNLGMYPVDFFAPIINYPQSAILATGRVRKSAEVQDTQIALAWRMWANLAVDHRVADGATAAEFLQQFEEFAESLPQRI